MAKPPAGFGSARMRRACSQPILGSSADGVQGGDGDVMYWNDGWAWFWMVPMMLLWVLVLGAVVYGAVRLANHDSHQH